MRVTANTLYRDSEASIQRASEQMLEYQRQVASGKRISKPSDDPTGMSTAIGERADIAATEQYKRTADTATSRLTVIDTALSDIIERLTSAQTATVAGRGTTKTQQEREAAAQALEGTKQSIYEDLNTSFHGAHVFAGADVDSPPYTKNSSGVISAYQGSSRQVDVEIDRGRSVTVGIDGSTVSRGASSDLFTDIDTLIAAVRSGDEAGITQGMAALQSAFDRATTAQTKVGTQMAAIETQQEQLTDRRLASVSRLNKTENVNMVEAISGMTQAEASYQAALAATGKLTQRSLMDYLS